MSKYNKSKKESLQSTLRRMIRKFDDPILKMVCSPVELNQKDEALRISDLMKKVLNTTELGVGLAAVQIGYPLCICVLRIDPNKFKFQVLINPTIVSYGEGKITTMEGCLSYPKFFCPVERWLDIKVSYLNEDFAKVEEDFHGFEARVVQHEVQHCQGMCLVGDYYRQTLKASSEPNNVFTPY